MGNGNSIGSRVIECYKWMREKVGTTVVKWIKFLFTGIFWHIIAPLLWRFAVIAIHVDFGWCCHRLYGNEMYYYFDSISIHVSLDNNV